MKKERSKVRMFERSKVRGAAIVVGALLLVLLELLAAGPMVEPAAGPRPPAPLKERAVELVRVRDGDTVVVRGRRADEIVVRLAGIDAPEVGRPTHPDPKCHGQPLAEDARRFVQASLERGGEILLMDLGRDYYGRRLGFLRTEHAKQPVNVRLAGVGLAKRASGACHPWCDEIRAAEDLARRGSLGLWRHENFEDPAEYRRRCRLGK